MNTRFKSGFCVAAALACAAGGAFAQGADEEFVVIHAGKIITVSGEEIDNGTIVIVDGKVRLVGRDVDYPAAAEIIDARDQVVMPGFIHAQSRANLPNYSRNGNNSHRNVTDDVRYDLLDFEALLEHGFTAVCLTPAGRGIPGMSAVYRTAGEPPIDEYADDERVLNETAYIDVSFTNPASDKPALRGALQKAESEIEKVEKARKEWEEKQKQAAEAKKNQPEQKPEGEGEGGGDQPPKEDPPGANDPPVQPPKEGEKPAEEKPEEFKPPQIDPASQRFVDLIQDKSDDPLLLSISGASDLLHARSVMEEYEQIPHQIMLQTGFRGGDFNYVIETLHQETAPIAMQPVMHTMPQTSVQFNLAGELAVGGSELVFVPTSDSASGLRDFRSQVAGLVAAGLPRDEAIAAMTVNAAKFVGVADRLGTIEKDKDADLVFLSGDPLDPFSTVERVMIQGNVVWESK